MTTITFEDSPRLRAKQFLLPHRYLDELRRAWDDKKLVLMLGAGLSQPYGLPGWDALILDLLVDSGPEIILPKSDPRALLGWIVDYLNMSPTVLGRVAQVTVMERLREQRQPASEQAFASALREVLYRRFHSAPALQTSLYWTAKLIAISEANGRRIPFVITFNFDDLLEQQLHGLRIKARPNHAQGMKRTSALMVCHPHGYLPQQGPVPRSDLIFTEAQYHEIYRAKNSWASKTILDALRDQTCLMIGLSGTDPNLRRLLDAIPRRSKRPRHFLVRKMPSMSVEEIRKAIGQIQKAKSTRRSTDGRNSTRLSRKYGSRVLIDPKSPFAFAEVLRVAMGYERRSLLDVGVVPLWIRDFEDLPRLIGPIARQTLADAP